MNGTLDLHIELEEALARFTGYEAAMTCSTGFQTNLAIISTICGRNDYILNDRENHASIYDACRLSPAQVLRTTLMATHTEPVIDEAVDIIVRVLKQTPKY